MARLGRRVATAVVLALALGAAPAAAQDQGPAVLLIMDASKSMAEDTGDGTTRLAAAKAALDAAVEALPEGARVGLRLYGHRRQGVAREQGCRDTELVQPIGPVDKPALTAEIAAYEARGRTPIGRSLRAAGRDLAGVEGRKLVVLVSDGGDNCAPPSPCDAARELARQDVDVTIQSVGFLVSERARAQLECVAAAGGGTYSDAADPEELTAVLGAAFARAFRDYVPQGEPIEGGETRDTATPISSGEWLDSLAGAGQERWYSIEVGRGERLWATATIVRQDTVEGDAGATALSSGVFRTTLGTPTDPEAEFESEGFDAQLNDVGGRGESQTLRSGVVGEPDSSSEYAEPGTYTFQVVLEPVEDFEAVEFPLEVVIHKLSRLPEAVPVEAEALADATPEPTPTPTPTPTAAQPQPAGDDDDGGTSGVLAGGAGAALGLVAGGGLALARRRRTP